MVSFFRATLFVAVLLSLAGSALAEDAATSRSASVADPNAKPGDGEFIRYLDGEDLQQLQTGIVRYARGGRIVDLVGAVHLADPEYFDKLNTQLKQYDVVLYEMVGGAFAERDQREGAPEIAQVKMLQGLVNRILGMEYQTEGIDYGQPNFVHADIDWSQYQDLMAARNQSLATLFQRAMALAESGEGPAILNDEAAANRTINGLITGLTTGNTAELKRSIAPFLGEAETLITQIEGDDGTVLVTERNKVVMEILQRELDAGQRNVAIFYGAGHFPDLEKRLLAAGFKRRTGAWLTAWNIRDQAPSGGANLLEGILSDPNMLQSIMSGAQQVLRQMQEQGERAAHDHREAESSQGEAGSNRAGVEPDPFR